MAKDRGLKSKMKPMGFEMIELIKDIQKRFLEKNGFTPNVTDITNMLARAIRSKRVYVY